MAAVWAAGVSAPAAMVAAAWYVLARNGGHPTGGDMVGHAATARWLRTLPWWDWRGWSDWFYGGQAIGVGYPPLGHAWLRFTHPGHGQMAAVALGLLVLLPWGSWRLARAVGLSPRAQRGAVAAVLVLVAFSGTMHWFLPGFHYAHTAFGGWPAMLATVLGLFCGAWAARCGRPVACGAAAGVAVLLNVTVVPGIALICAVLVASSGAPVRRVLRWLAGAGSAALAVCAWWLVPFVAGWDRLVRWEVPLRRTWESAGHWGVLVVLVTAVGAARAVRRGSAPAGRLALAALAALLATLVGDQYGYLRSERWLAPALLVAAIAAGELVDPRQGRGEPEGQGRGPGRWAAAAVVVLATLAVVTARRYEVLPIAVWLLWKPRRTWVVAGAWAWVGVLLFVPLGAAFRHGPLPGPERTSPIEAVAAMAGAGAGGLVHLDTSYETRSGGQAACGWGQPWRSSAATGGRIRPLAGLYRETSPVAEFLDAEPGLRNGEFAGADPVRPHWFDPWTAVGGRTLDTAAAAAELGARWFVECGTDGDVAVAELDPVAASGVTVTPHATEDAWHRDAVEWWVIEVAGVPDAGFSSVPILAPGGTGDRPPVQAASGVALTQAGDGITVTAEEAGWAWLRVPWDPAWRTLDGTPVHLGGPGHLVVWVPERRTELRWSVARGTDVAAAATTAAAVASLGLLVLLERRRSGRDPSCSDETTERLG